MYIVIKIHHCEKSKPIQGKFHEILWRSLNKFGDFINITDVKFSSPNIILVSFIETYYFFYNNLAEFFPEYLVRDTKGF